MSPSRLFILRPVGTSLLMAAILLAGLVSYRFLPLSALPEVDYPTIQVQTFYPSPMATATAMYHSGKNPLRKITRESEAVDIVKGDRRRRLHKAFLRYHDPNNWPLLREALKAMGRADLIGKDLRRTDLRRANLRGAYLIGANLAEVDLSRADLIGADLRAADVRGARLDRTLFLTQMQVDAALGDAATTLPVALRRPLHWRL